MSKIVSNGTSEDERLVVTKEEYTFVHQNWFVPSSSVYSKPGFVEYKVVCPEYAKLRQSRLWQLINE